MAGRAQTNNKATVTNDTDRISASLWKSPEISKLESKGQSTLADKRNPGEGELHIKVRQCQFGKR
jgi:hypothetical protein